MKKTKPDVDEFEQDESAADCFVRTLGLFIECGVVIINGPDMQNMKGTKTVSAKRVHKMVIGTWSHDEEFVYLFPEMLMKYLKKKRPDDLWHPVFADKEDLRKMLIRNDLILGPDDERFTKYVRYIGVRVKVWQLNNSTFVDRYNDYKNAA